MNSVWFLPLIMHPHHIGYIMLSCIGDQDPTLGGSAHLGSDVRLGRLRRNQFRP
jgi:ABC-type molybdate transport system permease subunit